MRHELGGFHLDEVRDHLHHADAVRLRLVGGGRERRLVAGVEHEVRTLAGEVERDLTPDATTRAGDDRDPVAEAELHQPSDATRSA